MPDPRRTRVIDAVDILNDINGDLVTGTNVLREYAKKFADGRVVDQSMVYIRKMCLSHLVLALCKFIEFWKHFKDAVPREYRTSCKAVLRAVEQRKVPDFRNKCVGHIWDDDQGRPLFHSEINSRLDVVMGNDLAVFLDWLNNPVNNMCPATVVSVVETLRDAMITTHAIRDEEFIDR